MGVGQDAPHPHRVIDTMEYRPLGRTGVQVSQLCFGTMSFGGDAHEATATEMYTACRDAGSQQFLITGTQTGELERLTAEHFSLVTAFDLDRNSVRSTGLVKPSSEAMTHAALYDLDAGIDFVYHAHAPQIWRNAAALGLPSTDPAAAYGTPEMARSIRETGAAHLECVRRPSGLIVMGGHEDGVISFGSTADEAGQALLAFAANA